MKSDKTKNNNMKVKNDKNENKRKRVQEKSNESKSAKKMYESNSNVARIKSLTIENLPEIENLEAYLNGNTEECKINSIGIIRKGLRKICLEQFGINTLHKKTKSKMSDIKIIKDCEEEAKKAIEWFQKHYEKEIFILKNACEYSDISSINLNDNYNWYKPIQNEKVKVAEIVPISIHDSFVKARISKIIDTNEIVIKDLNINDIVEIDLKEIGRGEINNLDTRIIEYNAFGRSSSTPNTTNKNLFANENNENEIKVNNSLKELKKNLFDNGNGNENVSSKQSEENEKLRKKVLNLENENKKLNNALLAMTEKYKKVVEAKHYMEMALKCLNTNEVKQKKNKLNELLQLELNDNDEESSVISIYKKSLDHFSVVDLGSKFKLKVFSDGSEIEIPTTTFHSIQNHSQVGRVRFDILSYAQNNVGFIKKNWIQLSKFAFFINKKCSIGDRSDEQQIKILNKYDDNEIVSQVIKRYRSNITSERNKNEIIDIKKNESEIYELNNSNNNNEINTFTKKKKLNHSNNNLNNNLNNYNNSNENNNNLNNFNKLNNNDNNYPLDENNNKFNNSLNNLNDNIENKIENNYLKNNLNNNYDNNKNSNIENNSSKFLNDNLNTNNNTNSNDKNDIHYSSDEFKYEDKIIESGKKKDFSKSKKKIKISKKNQDPYSSILTSINQESVSKLIYSSSSEEEFDDFMDRININEKINSKFSNLTPKHDDESFLETIENFFVCEEIEKEDILNGEINDSVLDAGCSMLQSIYNDASFIILPHLIWQIVDGNIKFRKKKIIEKELIFLPFIRDSHCSLYVISTIGKQVLYFDSLARNPIKKYNDAVDKFIKNRVGNINNWNNAKCPIQNDSVSCGYYTLLNIEFCIQNISQIHYYNNEDLSKVFTANDVKEKRVKFSNAF
jgi:hypothetical protein